MGLRNALTRATAPSALPASISWMIRLPITTASAACATLRADSASRIPKPTPTGSRVAARVGGERAAPSGTSMCAGAVMAQ